MQISNYRPRYIEKRITTEDGVFFARFVVVSEGNSFKLKLVEMLPVGNTKVEPSQTQFLLVAPKIKQIVSYIVRTSTEILSPFSNLSFFISQPTRAPSF